MLRSIVDHPFAMKLVPDKPETYPTRRGSGGISLLSVIHHFTVQFRLSAKVAFLTGNQQYIRVARFHRCSVNEARARGEDGARVCSCLRFAVFHRIRPRFVVSLLMVLGLRTLYVTHSHFMSLAKIDDISPP
jgi:hypothetical protein